MIRSRPPPPAEENDPDVKNIEWLTAEEFTVERGKEKIQEFVEV